MFKNLTYFFKLAKELGKADEERLIKTRKLVLLVDLDQTLIHTTNDNIPANLKVNISLFFCIQHLSHLLNEKYVVSEITLNTLQHNIDY